eukprot:CAMPEP_0206033236 /NCGR_PEP_ID=MMETSP1466-20131121/504_1 /ASSEMBLY_ACC=CAM_ASM_001126 /TAXON_ID=44452 /ORGANISM="Pavlova gyrans, Strain CCMP608" /LENGTH=289 /DNA_ID=CAMNT_0053407421 /DNA_START=17 /DNA_END=886 /DNA_ORIENTATION=-
MSAYDISSARRSTLVHAAPGGNSSFSLAHDSGPMDGMTPRERANIRKAQRQVEADRKYLESTRQLGNNVAGEGTTITHRRANDHAKSNIFDNPETTPAPAAGGLYKMSAPFGVVSDAPARSSTRVNAAPGGRATLVLGSDSPSWGEHAGFDKPRLSAQPRSMGGAHPEMKIGSQMASLLGGGDQHHVLAEKPSANIPPRSAPFAQPIKQAPMTAGGGPPDTSEMSHKERVAAMKEYRMTQEGNEPLGLQRQFTAGMNDGQSHTTECSIGDRPSSRVLAPPGGKSNFTFG